MHFNNIFRTFARLVLGILFIFSGYVKAIDPMGSAIKFGEYFEAFHLSALEPGALIFGVLLAQAELLIGLAFLFGMRMRLASWSALIFMIFFTSLTFILAKTDAVRDCGCFGDAVKLTNWQTFYKNLIILPFVVYVFSQQKKYRAVFSTGLEWTIAALITLASVYVSIYTYRHLPFIDFMPYKVGVNLPEAMKMPENAIQDEYESVFIYEKDGEQKQFTLENLPDSTWNFVDTKTKLIKQGYTPPAKDFTISDQSGNYVQNEVLGQAGYTLFLTSADGATVNLEKSNQIKDLYIYAQNNGIAFLFLSGSSNELNRSFLEAIGEQLPTFHTDETVLKSMVRSNPGLMLLKDATILRKWNYRDFPNVGELNSLLREDPAKLININRSETARINIILGIIVALLFMIFSIKSLANCRKKKSRFEQ